mgnify:CR=1 FL=1
MWHAGQKAGLLLVGDAFAFLDPVFSSGIFLALVGGELAAKEAGKMRAEGRDYIVKEGDVLLFRFNV